MKIKNLSIVGIATLAIAMSACPSASNTNTANTNTNANTTANKPAVNTSTPAVTTNTTNTASNPSSTDGQVLKIDEAGIMMTVPKGFKYAKDGDDYIVKTEDEGVDIRFSVPKDSDYNKAVTDAATEIDDYLKDVKITEQPTDDEVNGMKAKSMSGTATNEGEPVMWNLTIIDAPKRPVLANIYAEKTSLEKYATQVEAFLKSVKKQ